MEDDNFIDLTKDEDGPSGIESTRATQRVSARTRSARKRTCGTQQVAQRDVSLLHLPDSVPIRVASPAAVVDSDSEVVVLDEGDS